MKDSYILSLGTISVLIWCAINQYPEQHHCDAGHMDPPFVRAASQDSQSSYSSLSWLLHACSGPQLCHPSTWQSLSQICKGSKQY